MSNEQFNVFPQIALGVRVVASSTRVRVRRFLGFVLGGLVYGWVYPAFLDSFWGGCRARCRPMCRLMFSWWRVWLSVRRFFGFFLGGCRAGCRPMCRVVACSVRRFFAFFLGGCRAGCRPGVYGWVYADIFGFVLGGNKFLQCNDAKVLFCVCCCFASQSKRCDVINATMKNTA